MSNKSVWPPSNFEDFPLTRTGALAIDAIAIIAVIVGLLMTKFMYRFTPGISCSYYKRWGFWICGMDSVSVNANGSELIIKQNRCCCPCATSSFVAVNKEDVTSISIKKRPVIFAGVIWAFGTGCLIGIWLHFIPCIWWTCDWGPYDGEGVRGGIWFVMWAVMFVVLCFLTRTVAIEIAYKTEYGGLRRTLLAVDGGGAFKAGNLEAERVRKELSEFVFGNYSSMKEDA